MRTIRAIAALSLLACATPALADSALQDAIKQRSDLSAFYQALDDSGMIHEFDTGPFTVFAPVNAAFSKIPKEKYPCFYAPQCKDQVVNILQHHVLKGRLDMAAALVRGGAYTADSRFLTLKELHGKLIAGGAHVTGTSMPGGSVLYTVDAIFTDKADLKALKEAKPDPADDKTADKPAPGK